MPTKTEKTKQAKTVDTLYWDSQTTGKGVQTTNKGVKNVTVVGVLDDYPGSYYIYTFKTKQGAKAFIRKAKAHDGDAVTRWDVIDTTTDTPKATYEMHRFWVEA